MTNQSSENRRIEDLVDSSWRVIPPFWPLKNLIAANPLIGFEGQLFEQALTQAQVLFQTADLPSAMQDVNRESLKWLQAYFDDGQSTIMLPGRGDGFLSSILTLMAFDSALPNRSILASLPSDPVEIITDCLRLMTVSDRDHEFLLTLTLTTLSGWSSHILYRTDWAPSGQNIGISKTEFTAFRLILMRLFDVDAADLIYGYQGAIKNANGVMSYKTIQNNERQYQSTLFEKLSLKHFEQSTSSVSAQFVFCIDVRSEPFRRNLESVGAYETLGFAGFFGVPISVCQIDSGETYESCPVLVKAHHTVQDHSKKSLIAKELRELYQSTKYMFTTSFPLVETLGFWSGLMMGINTFSPRLAYWINKKNEPKPDLEFQFDIPLDQQVNYGLATLRSMGLVANFAPLVFFCGHRGESQNNALATSLDCGACGGRPGRINSFVLARILNNHEVRLHLKDHGISIPEETYFVAAEHNTTTDEFVLIDLSIPEHHLEPMAQIQDDLKKVQYLTSDARLIQLGESKPHAVSPYKRSQDWSQPRPEWALAKNASFIIAPRSITKSLDLEGRAFLHSYDWETDDDYSILTSIMTAPLIVGYWINAQYLFSTLDPVAYGTGSKVTKNIVGKLGITQGNLSDLMHGLPLQSIGLDYDNPYHEPVRLTVVVYAPKSMVQSVISKNEQLNKLVLNKWFHVFAMDPKTRKIEAIDV